MLIEETVKRECCHHIKDLKEYNGSVPTVYVNLKKYLFFCKECGQVWRDTYRMDAAGGTESCWEKVEIC